MAEGPEMFLFHPEAAKKYKLDGYFTHAKGMELLEQYLQGEAVPFLKSAQVFLLCEEL